MSFLAAAGLATAAVGLYSGIKSANAADRASDRQADVAKEQLDFTREQYDDWKAIYGPVEQNLAKFYENLTPEYFTAQGLQAYNQEFQQQQNEMEEFFAQNEIDPGVRVDQRTKMSLQAARDKSGIRADAPFKVTDEQNKFLAVGTGQKANILNNTTLASNALSNVYGNQSTIARQSADIGFQAASSGAYVAADAYDRERRANEGDTEIV